MGGRIEGTGDDARILCFDPRSGERRAEVPCTPPGAVAGLVERARAAQDAWFELGLDGRRRAVAELHQAFLARADEVVALLAEECGRPAGEAWTSEVVANHDLFRWWLGHVDDLLTPTPVDLDPLSYPRKRGAVRLLPRGVVGLITPWNLPVAIPLRTLVPALLAGNAVVFKPSEHSPRTGALLGELCAAALPEGVVTVVQGGAEQGRALVEARPDALVFTGSARTGRAISEAAGRLGLPVSLELGGKDAAIVLADAELDRAAAGVVWGAFAFAGQNCAAVERCYVDAGVFDAFVERVVERTRRLRPLADVGPLVTPEQLAIVERHVREAVAAGARALTGGRAEGPGLYHPPTVLVDVTEDMAVMREETFGPVLPIVPFERPEDAIAAVEASPWGLTASVWTRDLELGETLASNLSVGVATVNNHGFTGALPSAAWGGTKGSGHGVTNSRFALYELTRPQTVVVDAARGPRELWWYPYNDALARVASGMIALSRRGGERLQGLRAALSGFIHRWKDDP